MSKLDFIAGLIHREYERRKSERASYSLRVFARRLGCSAATLSEVMRGKRPVSPKLARAFIDKIHLEDEKVRRIQEALVRAPSEDRAEDILELERTVIHMVKAWNRHDTHEMAQGWAPEGCLIEPWGLVIEGRVALEKFYAAAHSTYLKDAQITMKPVRIRFAGKHLAFLDLDTVIRGLKRESDPGPFDMFLAIPTTMVRRAGRWLILATRPYSLAGVGAVPWGEKPPA